MMSQVGLDSIEAALSDIASGKPVIVVDDVDRENEGDLIMAAEFADAAWMGFIIRHSSGIVCVAMEGARADQMDLPLMVSNNEDPRETAYTVTVDASVGITTGVSGADRARAANILADPEAQPSDLRRPGHMLPLRARPGGVLERDGHTEASVDLCRLADCAPVGILAEVMCDDGEMMRVPELLFFARHHNLRIISISDLIAYRGRIELGEQAHAG